MFLLSSLILNTALMIFLTVSLFRGTLPDDGTLMLFGMMLAIDVTSVLSFFYLFDQYHRTGEYLLMEARKKKDDLLVYTAGELLHVLHSPYPRLSKKTFVFHLHFLFRQIRGSFYLLLFAVFEGLNGSWSILDLMYPLVYFFVLAILCDFYKAKLGRRMKASVVLLADEMKRIHGEHFFEQAEPPVSESKLEAKKAKYARDVVMWFAEKRNCHYCHRPLSVDTNFAVCFPSKPTRDEKFWGICDHCVSVALQDPTIDEESKEDLRNTYPEGEQSD